MFTRIRNRLTLVYAAIMVCFLMSFVVISYTGLVWVLYRQEQRDVEAFAREEAREHLDLLRQKKVTGNLPLAEADDQNDGELFHYAFDLNGQQVSASEPDREVRAAVLEHIGNWQEADGKAVLTKLRLPDGEKSYFMLCKVNVYEEESLLGTVYVGKDITSYYMLLKRLLLVLSLVGLLFLVIATIVGHILAGRAIIPIKNSFFRQREFVADASHELRTPLSVMLTSVDAIQTDDENKFSPFSEQVLDDMKGEIRRMTKIVSDLLTLARADGSVTTIVKETFDINMVAEKVVRSFQPLVTEKGIKLEFAGSSNLFIHADRERINQLLLILIDNAVKFVQNQGKITLTVAATAGSKRTINIIVQDNGVGIPAEQQQFIFERFYRIDKARSRESGGTGLGLSIAKWIVEGHGGTIRVDSSLGVGSTFVVNLPG